MSEYELQVTREDRLMCYLSTKVIKPDSKRLSSCWSFTGDKLCDTLQVMAPTTIKTVH